jgi:polyisoprenoid-binding protein YceI
MFSLLVVACGAGGSPAEEAPAAAPPADEVAEETVEEEASEEMESSVGEAEDSSASDEEAEAEVPEGFRRFVVVPDESLVSYAVEEEFFEQAEAQIGVIPGFSTAIGVTSSVAGHFDLGLEEGISLGDNTILVEMATLQSDQNFRDRRVRNDFLQTGTFPFAEFTATSIEDFPASYAEGEMVNFKLAGELTIRDVTQPVTFDVQAALSGDSLSGTATAMILMTDFNITPPALPILQAENEVLLTFDFTAREGA